MELNARLIRFLMMKLVVQLSRLLGTQKDRKKHVLCFVPSNSIINDHEFFFLNIIYSERLYFETVYILYFKANRSVQIYHCYIEPEKISFVAER